MRRGLRYRFSMFLILMATGILVISGVSLFLETRYHLHMYKQQSGMLNNANVLYYHLEQALLRSIIWTIVGSIALAVVVSLLAAKRLTQPLLQMKHVAEQMKAGLLHARTRIKGDDELTDLGQSINHLAEQLQTQEQLRITMTQDIAHELRTPLATLKSHMQAFIDGVWEPTPARISSCYEEIERLTDLVADLEQLTAMDSPHFILERKETDLTVLIGQSADLVIAAFMQKNVALQIQVPQVLRFSADPNRFTQILVNLLSNALKFTPEGGCVNIRANEDKDDTVLLTIQDTGPGIAAGDIPFVFERFYRADKSRNRQSGGSGIGLTIVKKLVLAHGGTIWIESSQGEGTIVFIRLPRSGDIPVHE